MVSTISEKFVGQILHARDGEPKHKQGGKEGWC